MKRANCPDCNRPRGRHAAYCQRLDEPEEKPDIAERRNPHADYFAAMLERQRRQEAEYERRHNANLNQR